MPSHVFVLQTQTAHASSVLVFRSLQGAYNYLQGGMPFEFHLVPFDIVANDLAERKSLHEVKPYKIAWNTDRTWSASVCRQEVIDDHADCISTMHSFHVHHNTLFQLNK